MKLNVALVVLLQLGTARADDPQLAQQHDRLARACVVAGHIDEAIGEFALAYRAAPLPKYIFNKAQLELRLSTAGSIPHMKAALLDFKEYLIAAPAASDRREVEDRIVELRARIESAQAIVDNPSMGPDDSPGFAEPRPAATATKPPVLLPPTQPTKSRKSLWTGVAIGGTLLGGLAVGLAIGLTRPAEIPESSLGNMEAHFQ